MKKYIEKLKNIFVAKELKDLRQRMLLTVGLLAIFRLGSFIVLPGVDPNKLETGQGGFLDMINLLLGGAFNRASVFALGIMPYISASIVIQLLTVALPYFQKLQKEGESGRKRITQITRVLTILITLGQSVAYIKGTIPIDAISPEVGSFMFTFSSMIILTGGTIFCMWLGEKITDKGVGNGISMLIMIGIIARFPGALWAEGASRGFDGVLLFTLELLALFLVVMGVVLITQAVRPIPVQNAKQVAGRSRKQVVGGGQRSYIPLRVNAAGVMPIIFAQSLMFVPPLIATAFQGENTSGADYIMQAFSDFTTWEYNVVFAILIIVFTFFYTAITINPQQIAEDMNRNGTFIPTVKPGEETAEYIGKIIDRITLPGSLFIAAVAVLPAIAAYFGVGMQFSQFYGGTSLLIMVGVVLDTVQQIDSHLLMQKYETLMATDKRKGRNKQAIMEP